VALDAGAKRFECGAQLTVRLPQEGGGFAQVRQHGCPGAGAVLDELPELVPEIVRWGNAFVHKH